MTAVLHSRRSAAAALAAVALALAATGCGSSGKGGEAKSASGSSYDVTLPSGWKDVTSKIKRAPARLDRVLVGPVTHRFPTNVTVIRLTPPGKPSLEELQKRSRKRVTRALDGHTDAGVVRASIDGDPALGFTYRFRRRGLPLRSEQLQVFHGGTLFRITLRTHSASFAANQAALRSILRSWHWR